MIERERVLITVGGKYLCEGLQAAISEESFDPARPPHTSRLSAARMEDQKQTDWVRVLGFSCLAFLDKVNIFEKEA